MKIAFIAMLLLTGYWAYVIGYGRGQEAAPEHLLEKSLKEYNRLNLEIQRLESNVLSPPTFEECVPIVQGKEVDEYEFCEELLRERAMRDEEDLQSIGHEREQWDP